MENGNGKNPEGLGFFCRISDSQHFNRIEDSIGKKGYFTDRVLFDRVSVHLSDLALVISPKGEIAYAVHIRPTKTGTTGNRGIRAESPVELYITERELEWAIRDNMLDEIQEGLSRPSFRPNEIQWRSIWEAIKRLRPQLADELRRLEQLRFDDTFQFDVDGHGAQMFFEKDAVGVAIQSAGIPFGGVFAELADGTSQRKTLLESLCGNTTEDVIIDHDVKSFPGFIKREDLLHACKLSRGERVITIYNVNRRRAEAALGVDLIYMNEQYNSFTFVQYKMLEIERTKGAETWKYRPDSQFEKDVLRMKTARQHMQGKSSDVTPSAFRLSHDPFFFKFCRRQHLKVNAGMLSRGHYLSLSHLDLIIDNNRGPRGGSVIGLDTMDRWLTRTQFASLVSEGWIGTSDLSEKSLTSYIERALDAGKSVLVAIGRNGTENYDDQ